MNPLIVSLSKNELFGIFNIGELEEIFSSFKYSIEKYRKGEIVRFQNTKYDDLLIVLSGEITAEMHDQNGKVVKLDIFGGGDTIAPGIIFRKDNRLPVTLASRMDSVLLNVPRNSLLGLAQERRPFLLALLEDIGDKIDFLARRIHSIEFRTIKQKIARYLLDLSAKESCDTIVMYLTREELSEMFGVTRPSLSRVFSELSRDGIIQLDGKTVRIIDTKELQKIIEENDA